MHFNKINLFSLMFIFVINIAEAHEKVWPEKRLKQIWPEAQNYTSKQITLTPGQILKLKNEGIKIGGEDRSPTFYFAQKKESPSDEKAKTLGVILFIDEYGENGLIEISIAMGTDGRIKKIDIWEHSENSLIAKEDFLKQFNGKNVKDSIIVNKDYRPIPGADKASEAIARAVNKALKISNTIFEKK